MEKGYGKKAAELFFRRTFPLKSGFTPDELLKYFYGRPLAFKNKKVLDAACGYGFEANLIHYKGGEVYGTDASLWMIKKAQELYPHLRERFHVAGLHKLPFPDNFFDIAVCTFGLHYAPKTGLKELQRCLKPGGLLVFWINHPFHFFFFRESKDYFRSERIKFPIPQMVEVLTMAHPLSRFLSPYFLEHFDLCYFHESRDWRIDDRKPHFLRIRARKRATPKK